MNHTGSHRKPSPPMMAKQACQLNAVASQMNIGGPIMLAKFVPQFTMPMEVARCSGGNHPATPLLHAGKFADSPKPRSQRSSANCTALRAKALSMAAADHSAAESP